MREVRDKAWLGQWLAAVIVATGIGFEIAMVTLYKTPAELGAALIATGALTFAIATKLKRR
jgi:hypothetical protein